MRHPSRQAGGSRLRKVWTRVGIAVGLVGICAAAAYFLGRGTSNHSFQSYAELSNSNSDNSSQGFSSFAVTPNERASAREGPIYPYSVVPGGVRTPKELEDAGKRDPLVGGHYSGFNYDKARVVELQKPQLVYVSYRLKSKIYWTKKKITLRKGEKIITDGKIVARTRSQTRLHPKCRRKFRTTSHPHRPSKSQWDPAVPQHKFLSRGTLNLR